MIWPGRNTARSVWFGAILCGLVLNLATLSTPSFAADQEVESNRIGLLVFMSYLGHTPLVLSPTRMRMLGDELLSAELESRGHQVVSYPELGSMMLEWRIRSDRSLDPAFLEALAKQHAVDRVLVASFVIYPDRLVVLSRGLEVESGWLVSAGAAEELSGDLWDDPGQASVNWHDVVARASVTVASEWSGEIPDGEAGTLIVLPVFPVGVGRGQSELATNCLLGSVLNTGRWSVPDPFLVVTTLTRAGYKPAFLVNEGRRELSSRFGAVALVIPSLVSFGQTKAPLPRAADEDDFDGEPPHQLETRVPVYLSLLVVDSRTGGVVSGGGEYLEPEDPQGLFGLPVDIRVSKRLRKGTDRLVRIIPEKGDDS